MCSAPSQPTQYHNGTVLWKFDTHRLQIGARGGALQILPHTCLESLCRLGKVRVATPRERERKRFAGARSRGIHRHQLLFATGMRVHHVDGLHHKTIDHSPESSSVRLGVVFVQCFCRDDAWTDGMLLALLVQHVCGESRVGVVVRDDTSRVWVRSVDHSLICFTRLFCSNFN